MIEIRGVVLVCGPTKVTYSFQDGFLVLRTGEHSDPELGEEIEIRPGRTTFALFDKNEAEEDAREVVRAITQEQVV